MSNPARPDSSYSRNLLTRKNYNKSDHLLSTFNNKNYEKNKPPKWEKRSEPEVDEPPVGSSDEEEAEVQDIDLSDLDDWKEKLTALERPKLDEKFANVDEKDKPAPRRSGRKSMPSLKQNGNSPELSSSQEKRPSSAMDNREGEGESDKEDVFDLWRSSQQPKRRRFFGNQTRSYGRAPNANNVPSSSTPSEPPSSNQDGKSRASPRKGGAKSQKNKYPKDKKSTFQVPREIDIRSPAQVNGDIKHEFKNPPPFPNDIASVQDPGLEEAIKMLGDDDASSLSSPANSPSPPSSDFNFELSQADSALPVKKEEDNSPPKPALCPMCKEEVDPEALIIFEAQPKHRFRDQLVFCDSHQATKAEKEWTSKGYPIIDWGTFDERIQRHFDDLEGLLVPDSSSYYRNLLDGDMKAGKAKNFRLTLAGGGLENISCGYYGTRGSGKMYYFLHPPNFLERS